MLLTVLAMLTVVLSPSSPLQCLQCIRLAGYPHLCPEDGTLRERDDWYCQALSHHSLTLHRDACMTWTLDNGTIVMQNFVDSEKVRWE